MRLDEIAHFATLGAPGIYIAKFTLYQIPYILPIAIPISSLISTIILLQNLSHTHELSALRACGFGLREILMPILITAAYLSVLNFYIVSEMATDSHLATGMLKSELRAVNPLLILHNKHLMRLKGYYFDTLGASRMGESAADTVLAIPNKSNGRLSLLLAKQLYTTPTAFTAKGLTIISSDDPPQIDFENMMIENIEQADTSTFDFAQVVQKKVWTLNTDHLRLPLLRLRLLENEHLLKQAHANGASQGEIKQIRRVLDRGYSEIIRRLSVAMATFTFTLMGTAFSMSISRHRSKRGLCFVIGLAALYIVAYFTAKGMDHHLLASSMLYLTPHVLIIGWRRYV